MVYLSSPRQVKPPSDYSPPGGLAQVAVVAFLTLTHACFLTTPSTVGALNVTAPALSSKVLMPNKPAKNLSGSPAKNRNKKKKYARPAMASDSMPPPWQCVFASTQLLNWPPCRQKRFSHGWQKCVSR